MVHRQMVLLLVLDYVVEWKELELELGQVLALDSEQVVELFVRRLEYEYHGRFLRVVLVALCCR